MLKVSEYPLKQKKNMLKNMAVLWCTNFYNISLNVLSQPFSVFGIYHFYALQISVKLGSKLDLKLATFPIFLAPAPTKLQFSMIFFSLIFSQPRDRQNSARDFLLSKYFLNNLLLTVFMQNTLSKLVELLQWKINSSLLGKTRARSVRNVCAKLIL